MRSAPTRICLPTLWPRPGSQTSSHSCLTGLEVGDMTYKVHIDGYNFLPSWAGEAEVSPRQGVPLLER